MGLHHLAGYVLWIQTVGVVRNCLVPLRKKFYRWGADEYFMSVILEVYTEGRYYHNLKHITYMLSNMDDFKLSKKEKAKLELAIWFHDFVYNSKRTDNEEKSAEVFEVFAKKIGIRENHIKEIKDLILDTKHKVIPKTKLGKIICDLDLRGMSEDTQPKNTLKIRKEYSHLSDKEFNEGRIKFLKDFLKRISIYHTRLYRNTLEQKARNNLLKEIENIVKDGENQKNAF